MRWRIIDEVKAGKGERICANVSCARDEGLEGMEVAFGYTEEGKHKNVLIKCVLCEKCRRKMRKAHDDDKSRKRSRSHPHGQRNSEEHRSQQHHSSHHERKRRKHEKASKELRHSGTSNSERFQGPLEPELISKGPLKPI